MWQRLKRSCNSVNWNPRHSGKEAGTPATYLHDSPDYFYPSAWLGKLDRFLINKQWEVIALEHWIDVTHRTGTQQHRPESPTITPPGMRWIQDTWTPPRRHPQNILILSPFLTTTLIWSQSIHFVDSCTDLDTERTTTSIWLEFILDKFNGLISYLWTTTPNRGDGAAQLASDSVSNGFHDPSSKPVRSTRKT